MTNEQILLAARKTSSFLPELYHTAQGITGKLQISELRYAQQSYTHFKENSNALRQKYYENICGYRDFSLLF